MTFTPSGTDNESERRRSPAMLIGAIASLVGSIVFVLSAATMVFLWIRFLFVSLGWLGLVLGIGTAPMGAAYPFLHWLAHGDFPLLIFSIWGVGIVGLAMTMAWAAWGRYHVWRPWFPRRRRPEPNAKLAVQEDD